jgi:hypothetical protein
MPRAPFASSRSLLLLIAAGVLVAGPAISLHARADAEPQLASAWRTEPVRIDGNDEEWRGLTVPFPKQRFALGLQNDADALYVCLTTSDRILSTQIARQGLILWLDAGAARTKKHQFGVQFPIDPRLAAARDPSGRWPRDGGDVGEWAQGAVGLFKPGADDPVRVPLADAVGIEARAARHGDILVYEIKVPMKGDAPYRAALGPGDVLHLELQTAEWRGALPPSRSPIGIGIGVAGSAPGGRGVVGYPAVDTRYLKRTDVKAVVRLASGT